MKDRHTQSVDPDDPTIEAVEGYLREHPDFFHHRTELLSLLSIPHAVGGAVSLIERQVSLLRERNLQLEAKLRELVDVARQNEELSTRLHRLALALMDAEDLNDVINNTIELLRGEFSDTEVVLRVLGTESDRGEVSSSQSMDPDASDRLFGPLFSARRPVCGDLTREQTTFLFADQPIRSAVFIPLSEGRRLGVLALGSPEAQRFHSGMGTLFLGYLGELVSRALKGRMGE